VESGVASDNAVEVIREVPVPVKNTGDPQVFGWLAFVVGSTCLGLSLVGFVPAGTLGAPLAVIFGCTALALVISTIWAANVGQSYVAGAFGIFSTFWVSYTGLVLGLTHGWFAITDPEAIKKTVLAFLLAWAVGIGLLTLSSVRLPALYTLDIALVDLALIILYFANDGGSAGLTKLGGYIVLTFAALGAYIWLSCADQSLGGPGYPLGKPLRS
jgi:hypothetical protein